MARSQFEALASENAANCHSLTAGRKYARQLRRRGYSVYDQELRTWYGYPGYRGHGSHAQDGGTPPPWTEESATR